MLPGGPADGSTVPAAVRAHLEERYGPEPQEASVTFLGTAPIRILRFVDVESGVVRYVSLGCSAEPMGDPSALVPDPTAPRAELSLVLRGGVDGVVRALAVLAAAPAVEGLVLSEGALIDLGEPLWPGAAFTAVVLRAPEIPDVELPGDAAPVRVFRAVPVTHTEAAWVRMKGAAELEEAWAEAGIDVTDPARSAVNPGLTR
ncbi:MULTISPECIES: suppressor of fused domain protein [Dietzia]|uniref:suppressor of fused domain protein n=1 Tax=Dietzia TaxID=37914 RepID=UPI000D097876|nr:MULTISPECIES: suppressor of fused domain protein [Dietzia]AVM65599.1 Suppressor of fused protein (SUFU) [Dietzia sp. oral taxon 368]MCT1711342.1 suppressor of fused domain protein [Dietzia cinnamea]MCT1884860.1 suppressor of fused domain protein [Dietzia cinnamea]MCT2063195.1 suppressor of fused domain protein [Dietzia cinnamea]MCT2234820.1 suppressor of fused domain protein [Dietzia cinnamea]